MTRDKHSKGSGNGSDTNGQERVRDWPGGLPASQRLMMREAFMSVHGNLSKGGNAKWLLLATIDRITGAAKVMLETLNNVFDEHYRAEAMAVCTFGLMEYGGLALAVNRLSDAQCRALLMGLMRD